MKENMAVMKAAGKEVYGNLSAYLVTALAAAVVLVFYASLTNVPLITQALSSGYSLTAVAGITLSLVPGLQASAGTAVFLSVVVLSILVGVNVAFLRYKVSNYGFTPSEGGLSMGGVAAAALGSGCPACATGLLTLAGVTGGLAIFPFHGWELRIGSLVLLAIPIYLLSQEIVNKGACSV